MKILVIGGTAFVGYAVVAAARAKGHELTLFNRGRGDPGAFPGIELVKGDRDTEIDRLAGRSFDAVVDCCGYRPEIVARSVEALKERVGRYLFVSTVSVYREWGLPDQDENSPVFAPYRGDDPQRRYGERKVACEQEVERVFASRALILRLGLVAGPRDVTDRFTYWSTRCARPGPILAPGRPERLVQFIDARDVGEFAVLALEKGASGIYNVDGPSVPMRDILVACAELSTDSSREGSGDKFIWVDEEHLAEHKVAAFTELPLWLPGMDDRISSRRALELGLRYRPIVETACDTRDWFAAQNRPLSAGLSPEREESLLESWEARALGG